MPDTQRTEAVARLVPGNTGGATGVLGEVELTSALAETPVVRTAPVPQAGDGGLLIRLTVLVRTGGGLQDLLSSASPHLGGFVALSLHWAGQLNKLFFFLWIKNRYVNQSVLRNIFF